MVNGSDEANDGDEQQEDAHRYDASDDVDAGHQAEAFPPDCHSNEQQPNQLEGQKERS